MESFIITLVFVVIAVVILFVRPELTVWSVAMLSNIFGLWMKPATKALQQGRRSIV
jgi:hypothetical protein